MGKEYKKGLDYFPFDTNFKDKIELVEAKFGLIGIGYLIRLWQHIYKQNWYIEWNEDVELLFCRNHMINYSDSQEIFKFLLEKNVFSLEVFQKFGILTSKSIQRRYFHIAFTLKRQHEDYIQEYILVEYDKIKGKESIFDNYSGNFKEISGEKQEISRNIPEKKRQKKRKEIKENNTIEKNIYCHSQSSFDTSFFDGINITEKNIKDLYKKVPNLHEYAEEVKQFEQLRKSYRGSKKGFYIEFSNFIAKCKKNGVELKSELNLLFENYSSYEELYKTKEKRFIPHFSTFINQRRYQEPEIPETLPLKRTNDNMTIEQWKRLNKTEFDTIEFKLNQMCIDLSNGKIKESDIPKFNNPNYPKSVNDYFQNEVYKYIESAKELANMHFGNSQY